MEVLIIIAITVAITLIIVYALNHLKNDNKNNPTTGGGQNTPDRTDEGDNRDQKLN